MIAPNTYPLMPPASRKLPIARIAVAVAALAGLVIAFRMLPLAVWLRQFQLYVRGLGALGYVVLRPRLRRHRHGRAGLGAHPRRRAIFGVTGGAIVVNRRGVDRGLAPRSSWPARSFAIASKP